MEIDYFVKLSDIIACFRSDKFFHNLCPLTWFLWQMQTVKLKTDYQLHFAVYVQNMK